MVETANMKILTAMSGGVDSSVAALLLKQQGHEVVGAYFRTDYCNPDDRRDALRVAALLEIPLVTLDVGAAYEQGIIRGMRDSYAGGKTPNPDIDCNAYIKFPLLWQEAAKIGAEAIATGHYAQSNFPLRVRGTKGGYELRRSVDEQKDQTYFLYRLTKDDLSHTLFPIGHLTKTEVRRLAREAGFPVASKRSTSGVCFVGPVRMKSFLSSDAAAEEGSVVTADGRGIGAHDGAQFYTIGQRVPVSGGPYYVVSKQTKTNTLVVAAADDPRRLASEVTIADVHWIAGGRPATTDLLAKVRSRGEMVKINFSPLGEGGDEEGGFKILFDQSQTGLAPGQHLVLYNDNVCLGGGTIV